MYFEYSCGYFLEDSQGHSKTPVSCAHAVGHSSNSVKVVTTKFGPESRRRKWLTKRSKKRVRFPLLLQTLHGGKW